jgi:hypothetical protein
MKQVLRSHCRTARLLSLLVKFQNDAFTVNEVLKPEKQRETLVRELDFQVQHKVERVCVLLGNRDYKSSQQHEIFCGMRQ